MAFLRRNGVRSPIVQIAGAVLGGCWSALFALEAIPRVLRVSPPPGGVMERSVVLTGIRDAQVLAVETACPCIRVLDHLPQSTDLPLRLAIQGSLPGAKILTVRTTRGSAQVTVLVDLHGEAAGHTILAAAGRRHAGKTAWLVAHAVGAGSTNCGCSTGSLGGVEVLAGLPAAAQAAGFTVRAALTGDVEADIAARLAAHGWQPQPTAIPTWNGEATTPWMEPTTVAVVATARAPENVKILNPVPGGLVVDLVVVEPTGRIAEIVHIPVDKSLPIIGSHRPGGTRVEVDGSSPSTSCVGCHATASAHWQTSAHARAWESLPEHAQTTACAVCHVTPRPSGAVAGGVHCQACHLGADAHGTSRMHGGLPQRTTGLKDCRSCHDAAHHPAFDPVGLWNIIKHGRE